MTDYIPDPAEQAARICDMQAAIFDDPDAAAELLAATDTQDVRMIKSEQAAIADANRRLDELEGAALAGELEPDQIQQLRRLQARARLAGLRRRYL